MDVTAVEPVWTPDPERVRSVRIEHYRAWVNATMHVELAGYADLLAWSVRDPESFWASLVDYFEVPYAGSARPVLARDDMPGASWFPGMRLNYVNQVFRAHAPADEQRIAILDRSEPGGPPARDLTYGDLREQVVALAATLRRLGVGPGDVVAGYLPNCPEAVVAFLATASLGAVWSACGQDYAPAAALDRLGQLRPVVLVAADGYRYAGRDHDRRAAVRELGRDLGVRATILVPRLAGPTPDATATLDAQQTHSAVLNWVDATKDAADPRGRPIGVPVDFAHPLWVLFSSGTTGKPKGIVQGHGGIVLEHLKQVALHNDLGPGDAFFWYTSPSWMMWNYQVAGLLVGATIVTYDGSPAHPTPDALWALAAQTGARLLGTSPAYLLASQRAELTPAATHDLSALEVLGVTGSVLPAASCRWACEQLGPRVAVAAISGGTDVCTAFAGFVPTVPVWPGELSVVCLGTALEAWVDDGAGHGVPVVGEVGELVITSPMPSMPVAFWDDPDGERLRSAYFEMFPGIWRHGDWITRTERGSVVIHGRSDSTLNRNGVRMGSADIYQAIETMPEIVEALVLGVELPGADAEYWMPLFVVLADGVVLDDALRARIAGVIRDKASPRHVPDDIIAVPGIPHTRTGKKLEVPVKRILQGAAIEAVSDAKAVDDPGLLAVFRSYAR